MAYLTYSPILKITFRKDLVFLTALIVVLIIITHFYSLEELLSEMREFRAVSSPDFNYVKGLTFQCSNGELGNKMFFYAVVYGLSRLNNRHGYLQECNAITCQTSEKNCTLTPLNEIFYLSLPVGPDLPVTQMNGHLIKFHISFPEDYNISADANVLVGEPYPVSTTYFLHVREEIRRQFNFRTEYQDYANTFLTKARATRTNVTLVGVHVRRGSYLYHLNAFQKQVAPRQFFLYAMRYFRRTLGSVLFVVLSDDLLWCWKNLAAEDVYVADMMSSAVNDLAVLSSCQHVIFDYGTYGLWAAFLAGGKAMYYIDGITDPTQPDTVLAQKMYPPDWIGVSNDMLIAF